ncbi:MAG: hypothetical protein NT033_00610, partial [Candidatus Omnitrophica bacterium]|nr:hypothetical protein [Candidatus Omnitrophota bacterium]
SFLKRKHIEARRSSLKVANGPPPKLSDGEINKSALADLVRETQKRQRKSRIPKVFTTQDRKYIEIIFPDGVFGTYNIKTKGLRLYKDDKLTKLPRAEWDPYINPAKEAIETELGRFKTKHGSKSGAWWNNQIYIRYFAWLETPLVFLLGILFIPEGYRFLAALAIVLGFSLPHLIGNREALRSPSVRWLILATAGVAALIPILGPTHYATILAITGLTIVHASINLKNKVVNWKVTTVMTTVTCVLLLSLHYVPDIPLKTFFSFMHIPELMNVKLPTFL